MKALNRSILSFSRRLDAFNNRIGHAVAWLSLAMVVVIAFTVIQRYVFSSSHIWQQELARNFHAILFLGAAGYTLLQDEHVRVDIFYQRLNKKKRAWVNLLGTLLLLFPMCIAIIIFSEDFVLTSWRYLEASTEYNGLPGLFLLKSCIWGFCLLLLLQGTSTICRAWLTIKGVALKPRKREEHQQLL